MGRTIPLTKGFVALVDDEDYEWLSEWKWFAQHSYKGAVYAARHVSRGGKSKTILMHRVILGIENAGRKQQTDHINGDRLDNRRCNLRLCVNWQNAGNYGAHKLFAGKTPASKYRGVSFRKNTGLWDATTQVFGVKHHLGQFDTEEQAARAWDKAALQRWGEFARLNFPD